MSTTESLPPSVLQRRLRPIDERAIPDGLVLHEIYASIQGESTHAGRPCTFIRTTGCHLRCGYCDTPHAFTEGRAWTLRDIRAEVDRLGVPLVELTGGEPLLQPNVLPLMTDLCDAGYTVLLETSGSIDFGAVDPRVVKIVDIKTPSSGEHAHNRVDLAAALLPHDEIKLVIGSRDDYAWARELIAEHHLAERCTVLLGPVFGAVEPREVAAWILADRLPVRLQIQLHKVLWDPRARGV